MGERLQPSVILATTFIGLAVLLIGVSSAIHGLVVSRSDVPQGYDTVGFEFNFWPPTAGYTVHSTDTQIYTGEDASGIIYWDYDEGDSHYYGFEIPYGSGPGLRVWLFRNNSDYNPSSGEWDEWANDFFVITRHTQDWPVFNVRKFVVPFETVLANMEGNSSMCSGHTGKVNCTLFINCTTDLQVALYSNEGYTIRMATGLGEMLQTTSVWTIMGQILGMKLPGCHWVVDLLIAIPFWASIGFIAVTLILRAIPFVGD